MPSAALLLTVAPTVAAPTAAARPAASGVVEVAQPGGVTTEVSEFAEALAAMLGIVVPAPLAETTPLALAPPPYVEGAAAPTAPLAAPMLATLEVPLPDHADAEPLVRLKGERVAAGADASPTLTFESLLGAQAAAEATPAEVGPPVAPPELVDVAIAADPDQISVEPGHAPDAPQTAEAAPVRIETPGDNRAPAPLGSRVNHDTVAALSAEISRKLDARVTRFEVELAPEGLGAVSVSLEIGSGGDVSAHLSFERPDSAAELRARAGELRDALEDAGFSLNGSALSFADGRREPPPEAPSRRARRDWGVDDLAPPSPTRRAARAGVDLRI